MDRLSRSRWPRGLRCKSTAAELLGLRVQIPPGAWMSVPGERCDLSEVFATGRLLVQRSPTDCVCICVCVRVVCVTDCGHAQK